jgi:uncharacterized Zn finger protein
MPRYDGGWPAYVPVAERRRKAEREAAKLRKKGHATAPVQIEGRAIVTTVWGKAWCDNLESYRDYESRLPRGRTYVRNGSVIDLQIRPREVKALVSGSAIYKVTIGIASVPAAQWQSICAGCAGRIDSLVEILQGRLSKGVMERICRQGTGLFPKPSDIRFSCSCPDFASMCKHVAAVLYGVGARLDRNPELLFRMRAVDENDLLADLDDAIPASKLPGERVLAGEDVSALFGLDLAEPDGIDAGTGGSLLHPLPRDASTIPSPPKQTAGRSRPMSPKKTSPAANSVPAAVSARAASAQAATPKSRTSRPTPAFIAAKGAQPRVPTTAPAAPAKAPVAAGKSIAAHLSRSNTLGKTQPETLSADETPRVAAAGPPARTRPGTRTARASNAPVRAERAMPAGQTAKAAPAPGAAAASRQHPRARQAVAQVVPARAGSGERGAGRALEAVLAHLESIGRGLGELDQLRADVQTLSRRIDELAAAMADQGKVPAERDPEPKRVTRKGHAARASRVAEPGGIGGKGNVAGRGRDPGDAVPPGVAVQTPAPLRPGDEAVLDALEELPRRVARPRGKAGGRSRK